MSSAFQRELRNTKSSFGNLSRTHSAKPNNNSNVNVAINLQKRDKLKMLLIEKFMKKYHITSYDPLINNEVAFFLQKETLTDNDLKALDKKIEALISKRNKINSLSHELINNNSNNTNSNYPKHDYEEKERAKTCKPHIDKDNISVCSQISGASKLSKAHKKHKDLNEEDIDYLSENNDPIERVQFQNEKDEWNAINKYNQFIFEQDKKTEKQKDQEVKRRTKEDLDNQIKQKMLRIHEERLKVKEYDKVTIDHVEKLKILEQDRKQEMKEKMLREKESRDAQRLDELKKKKIENMKNRKYEKELCKYEKLTYLINN